MKMAGNATHAARGATAEHGEAYWSIGGEDSGAGACWHQREYRSVTREVSTMNL